MKIWTMRLLLGAVALLLAAAPVDMTIADDGSASLEASCASSLQGCKPKVDWVCFHPTGKWWEGKCNNGEEGCELDEEEEVEEGNPN